MDSTFSVPSPSDQGKQRIAVVGSGIAGLSAAWLLSARHQVTVFERDGRPGGHSNTVDVETPRGRIPVDTGFIVYNEPNYPNLTALFEHLGVETQASDMSFAVSADDGTFEYAGTDLDGLLGQRGNILRPRFWRMVAAIRRFYATVPALLEGDVPTSLSLGQFLHNGGYPRSFVDDHLAPMGAAIWSCSVAQMLEFPAITFARFFDSHGLLRLKGRPQWRTVKGGSRAYVEKMTALFADGLQLGRGARRICRLSDAVVIEDRLGRYEEFDQVVIAAHADQALALLADADEQERHLLGRFGYQRNLAVLHDDARLMPRRRRVWSSWNYLSRKDDRQDRHVSVTYWMNRLQGIDPAVPLFVSLNPHRMPGNSKIFAQFEYDHPVFDAAAIDAQPRLWELQGRRRTWFCGSYFGYGFHEDALQAGLAVAEALGGQQRPWKVENASGRIFRPAREAVAA